jgi:hypothetical protein
MQNNFIRKNEEVGLTQNRLHHSAGHRSLGAAGGASRDERGRWSDFSRICEPQYRLSWFRFFISPDGMRSPMRMSSGTAPHSRSPLRTGPVGRKKPASPLALTDRGRIAPASRRSAGGAGVSTSAMGHCGDIQAKDPIDCGEPLFAAAIAGAAAPTSAAAT